MFDRELISFLAGFFIAAVSIVLICILFRFDFRSLSNRVDDLEDDLNNFEVALEGFFKFREDGSICKVSDLGMSTLSVDIKNNISEEKNNV
jgi:hypothetical protein